MPIPDNPPISLKNLQTPSKKESLTEIAEMTFSKIRLGIMDQPQFNNTRTDASEILNKGSRLNPTTAHQSFVSFLDSVCKKDSFDRLAARRAASRRPYALLHAAQGGGLSTGGPHVIWAYISL